MLTPFLLHIVDPLGTPAGEQGDAVRHHLVLQGIGYVALFTRQQLIGQLHLGDRDAKQGEALGQLAADGAAAKHQQAAGRGAQLPEGI